MRLLRPRQAAIRRTRGPAALLLLAALALLWGATGGALPAGAAERCETCHREQPRFAPAHDPRVIGCTACHAGNGAAKEKSAAHAGLEAFPGRTETVAQRCGQSSCHEEQVALLRHSIMHTFNGVIEVTRAAFGADAKLGRGLPPKQRLAEQGIDSYLRKLCASCHLANDRRNHGQSLADRGGGCSACHLQVHAAPAAAVDVPQAKAPGAPPANTQPEAARPARPEVRTGVHPTLTLVVPDERCFGCHSRSERIALNYVGLAEVDGPASAHLQDGRAVTQLAPDLHSVAGLACTDCHTAAGVMGTGQAVTRYRQQLDVACTDCHAPALNEKPVAALTRRELVRPGLLGWTSPALRQGRVPVTARRGTPLWNLYRDGPRRMLRLKTSGKAVPVPVLRPGRHHDRKGHERLTCSACHDTWAPQCDGCHISYDPAGRQWDHLSRAETPGRWIERRWHVRNEAPALGVTADGQIAPFVPGMSLEAALPGRREPLRRTRYARLAPHTTQRAGRGCASCHRSEGALGVIRGEAVAPWDAELRRPIGWVARDAKQPAPGLHAGDRSLNRAERARVRAVGACLDCHAGASPIYDDFAASNAAIAGQRPHPEPGSGKPPP